MQTRCPLETVMCWSYVGDKVVLEFWRNDDYYVFPATKATLQQVLLLVVSCAHDPEQSLTLTDAAHITQRLRDVVGAMDNQWQFTEAPVMYDYTPEEVADARHAFGWCVVLCVAFWCCVFWYLAVM